MSVTLDRRLVNFRATGAGRSEALETGRRSAAQKRGIGEGARRLATVLGGQVLVEPGGSCVRIDRPAVDLPIDRERLAGLPGHPPTGAPLVCLDTETTGLATAAGTVAFLVGLGWWEGDRFRQAQLLLPDHSDEDALLRALEALIPADAWLVTYNGRGFDWPLLVARYRMHGRNAPDHAGHLDLLPFVRRVFRHRLPDARLRTVETHLLDVVRHGDVEGWEIPGRYFDVLRGGPPALLADVIRHNDVDVRSLAMFIARIAGTLGDPDSRGMADPGDLAGLARAYRLAGRLSEALECLDLALAAPPRVEEAGAVGGRVAEQDDMAWWRQTSDVPWGMRRGARLSAPRVSEPWTEQRLLIERAHLLRRLGSHAEAAEAWAAVAAGPGHLAAPAWLEVAKIRERRLGDLSGALGAVERAVGSLERRRRLGLPDPRLEAAAEIRRTRLWRRLGVPGAATFHGAPPD